MLTDCLYLDFVMIIIDELLTSVQISIRDDTIEVGYNTMLQGRQRPSAYVFSFHRHLETQAKY
jgi:hypothetical protein